MKQIFRISFSLGFFMTLFIGNASAQEIQNMKVDIKEDQVVITYDLIAGKENKDIEVRLFSNLDGYEMRLYRGEGDVGKNIKPGENKTIVWKNDEELTRYNKNEMTYYLKTNLLEGYTVEKDKDKEVFAGAN